MSATVSRWFESGPARFSKCALQGERGTLEYPFARLAVIISYFSRIDRTATAVDHWLDERTDHLRSVDTDNPRLTGHDNRRGANEPRRILVDLCEQAGIPHENRVDVLVYDSPLGRDARDGRA